MKKEKQVRTYQRRTKTGKLVTVRAHTASYEAAERAKEMAAKKGAGDELEEKMKNKKKPPVEMELPFDEKEEKKVSKEVEKEIKATPKKTPTKKATSTKKPAKSTSGSTSEAGISSAAFKSWYHFNDWDSPRKTWPKEVRETDAALKKKMGKKAYDKFCSDVDSNYSSRGHISLFKKIYPEQYSKEKGSRQLVGAAKAQKAIADKMGAKEASKKFDKVIKSNSPTSKRASSKSSLSDRAMQDLIKKGYSEKVLGKMKDEGYNFHSQKWSGRNEKTPLDTAYKMYGGKKVKNKDSNSSIDKSIKKGIAKGASNEAIAGLSRLKLLNKESEYKKQGLKRVGKYTNGQTVYVNKEGKPVVFSQWDAEFKVAKRTGAFGKWFKSKMSK